MTDTATIAERLRGLLDKVTPGPWKHTTYMSGTQNVEYPGARGITFADQVLAADASSICHESDAQPFPFINVDHRPEDKGKPADPQRSTNAAYVAACHPDNIRALLDERDRLTAEITRRKQAGAEERGAEREATDEPR